MIKLKKKIKIIATKYNGVKFLTPFVFLLVVALSSFMVGTSIAKEELENKITEIDKFRNDSLEKKNQRDSLELELKKIKDSKDYLRLKVYNSSGISIPSHVPKQDLELMIEQADKYNIPHNIYFRLIKKESTTNKHPNGFDRNAVNRNSGATGYMQLMPGTFRSVAKEMGLKGSNTPLNNILVGSFHINQLRQYWSRKTESSRRMWVLTLASYNAGINAVISANNNVPKYTETRKYLNYILQE